MGYQIVSYNDIKTTTHLLQSELLPVVDGEFVSGAEYGGLGLDYSYSIAVAEELGNIRCGGVPMAIGVQTDMATPALAR